MAFRFSLKLLILIAQAAFLALPAYAETNVLGDEIIILGDPPAALDVNPVSQVDPVLSYLPDNPAISEAPENTVDATHVDDLWQRIRDGYAMPELKSEYTAAHESWYASRPEYVRRMVERSQKYLYHIVQEVEKRGMPTEIALLPMVESAFNPQAYSRSRASGIWQFMPATGKDFGLKQTWWSDNRRDVTAATDAALNYLQKLHVMFGSWDLALAAYNAGEGTVSRAIERNRRKGLPTDYESLSLPVETKNYVPKLQAVKNIMTHPELYGLQIETIPNRPYFTNVTAPQQIDAHLAAQLAEISFEEFSSLNPEYNRPVITATGKVHEILLPVGAAETFTNNLAGYDKPLVSWQTYHAKRGERMENIARKFGISLTKLRDVNDLPSRRKFAKSRQLLVPNNIAQGSKDDIEPVAIPNAGDIPDLSESMNASIDESPDATSSSQIARRHIVKKNESLGIIAKRYGMSNKQLMALNHLKNSRLKTGQSLVINGKTSFAAAKSGKIVKVSKLTSRKKTRYIVKRGDTLDSIARRFDVASADLKRWNNIPDSHIVPGDKLTVAKPDEA